MSANTQGSGPKPEFKAGFDYATEKAKAKLWFNLCSFQTDGTVSYLAHKNLAVASNFVVNVKASTLDKLDWGLSWNPADNAFVGLKHESVSKQALSFGKFFLFVNHVSSASQIVGTEFSLDWATRVVTARLGLQHKFNDDSTGKIKISEKGCLDALLKHRINNNVTATFATGTCLKGIIAEQKAKQFPIGVGLDLKF